MQQLKTIMVNYFHRTGATPAKNELMTHCTKQLSLLCDVPKPSTFNHENLQRFREAIISSIATTEPAPAPEITPGASPSRS